MKKVKIIAIILLLSTAFALCGCEYHTDKSSKWKKRYDISLPNVPTDGATTPNNDGWYATLISDFEDNSLGEIWQPMKNSLRREEYWCDKMISLADGKVNIAAKKLTDHQCENCPEESGYFTSGIVTTKTENGKHAPTFEQAFGYFEATVMFPNSDGMWSAFWLNTATMRKVGAGGTDGAEIDIYESSFFKKRSYVGNCIHYDGYHKDHKAGQATHDVGYDLYEGFHTFALKWTPQEYVFFVDGVAVWATDFGGVSRVASYVMLTNEIRQEARTGPYGQRLGEFTGGTFVIESVKIYQNTAYLAHISG